MITFTRIEQLLASLGLAIAVPVAQALINFNQDVFAHPSQWISGLAVGVVAAAGLWLKGATAKS